MDTTMEIGVRTIIAAVLAVAVTLMMAASVSTLARTSISGDDASLQMYAQQHSATHLVV